VLTPNANRRAVFPARGEELVPAQAAPHAGHDSRPLWQRPSIVWL